MNFLIISGARCGSSSLQQSIANSYGLKSIFEPYSPWGLQRKNYRIKNVVVKTIFHQINNHTPKFGLGKIKDDYFEKCYDFYLELIPKFDKVILLYRKNRKEQAESLAALYAGNDYDVKYVYNLHKNNELFIDEFNKEYEFMDKISKKLNIPLDFYEDVYYGDGLKDKSIKLDLSVIDNKNKLRQYNIDKTLI